MKKMILIKDLYEQYYKKWKEGTLNAKELNMDDQEFEMFIEEMKEILKN